MPENWILVTLNINREVCTFVYVLQQCGYGTSTTYLYEFGMGKYQQHGTELIDIGD